MPIPFELKSLKTLLELELEIISWQQKSSVLIGDEDALIEVA